MCTFFLVCTQFVWSVAKRLSAVCIWVFASTKMGIFRVYYSKHCTQKPTCIEWKPKQKIQKTTSNGARMLKWFIATRLQHAGFVIDLFFLSLILSSIVQRRNKKLRICGYDNSIANGSKCCPIYIWSNLATANDVALSLSHSNFPMSYFFGRFFPFFALLYLLF